MAAPQGHTLTFLRGAGFLLNLVGVWDLMPDASGSCPSQKGFLIFNETKITAVIDRHEKMRRGIEGTYAVEGNRIVFSKLSVDTAPDRGPLGEAEFRLDGDTLTLTWLSSDPTGHPPRHVDTFRRRAQPSEEVFLLPPTAIYESDAPGATERRDMSTPLVSGKSPGNR
jgi:hypothetical protein